MEKEWLALTAADPTWKEGNAEQRLTDLRSGVASQYGVPAQDLAGIYHNGFIRMAQDALAFRKAQGTKMPSGKKAPARVVRGGKGKGAATPNSGAKAKADAALKKTGEVLDPVITWGEYLD
jgi:hypothetical protein